MPKIQVSLNDTLAQKLASRASELGLELSEFLAQAIQQNADKLTRPKVWIPREEWDARVRGDNCHDCVHLATGENPNGYTIAHLRVSRLDLLKTQFVPGCCVLYYKEHFIEPYQLEPEKQQLYFTDMMQAAQALVKVFKPIKMNYQILGNSGPHLHCILQPRFYGDSEPGWPIDPYKEQVILTPKEYKERIRLIQTALEEESFRVVSEKCE